MSSRTRQRARRSPPAVAVHDDADVNAAIRRRPDGGAFHERIDEMRWRASPLARRPNERFHVVEIPLQRATAAWRDSVLRLRHAALERFGADDVLRLLELARVDTEIPVGRLHELLQ